MFYRGNDALDEIPLRELLRITKQLSDVIQTLNEYILVIHGAQEDREIENLRHAAQSETELDQLF